LIRDIGAFHDLVNFKWLLAERTQDFFFVTHPDTPIFCHTDLAVTYTGIGPSGLRGTHGPAIRHAITDGRSKRFAREAILRANFFVYPMTTVVTPPNLPAHKPTGNCASGDDDRP
jgi:hypothetical protein